MTGGDKTLNELNLHRKWLVEEEDQISIKSEVSSPLLLLGTFYSFFDSVEILEVLWRTTEHFSTVPFVPQNHVYSWFSMNPLLIMVFSPIIRTKKEPLLHRARGGIGPIWFDDWVVDVPHFPHSLEMPQHILSLCPSFTENKKKKTILLLPEN